MSYSADAQVSRIGTTVFDAIDRLKSATTSTKAKPADTPAITPAVIQSLPANENNFAPVPASAPAGSGPSVISLKVEMTGTITSSDEVHIHGSFEGNVRASSLTICKGGSVKGEVVAETVIVQGDLEGRIFAQKVQILAGAVVRGDVIHDSLAVDADAIFEGLSRRSETQVAEAA